MDVNSQLMGFLAPLLQARGFQGFKPPSVMEWGNMQNQASPYSFNTVNRPDWFNATYNWTQTRPMGATYAHPEGLQDAYDKRLSQNPFSGLLGLFNKTGA